jgi:hypothetical protein
VTAKKSRFAGIAAMRGKLPAESQEHQKAKTGRPPAKKSNPDYTQVTVYLRKETHAAARKLLFDGRRQFSDLVDKLVSDWVIEVQKSGNSKV